MTDDERRSWFKAGKPPLVSEPEPKPQPAQPAATMTPEASLAWNRWANSLIDNHAMVLAQTIGEEVGRINRIIFSRIDAVELEFGQLRAQLEILRNATTDAPVDLPNWRKKRDVAA
jgi:hypothetical protein